MTVAELIKQLKNHPGDMRVVISGYEGGIDDVEKIDPIPIKLNCNEEWYYGKHDTCKEEEKDETALLIE